MSFKNIDSSEPLRQLVQRIETQLDWGAGDAWTNKDFRELSERIFDRTRQQLSVTTLKRVWGRAERIANPSGATLDILAEFAGYDSWRAFRQQHAPKLPQNGSLPSVPQPKPNRKVVGGAALLLALLSVAWYAMQNREAPTDTPALTPLLDSVVFSFEKVTTGYPNTVIFRYDVGELPYDSLSIQQSWDTRKRLALTEPQGLATSTYYYPGYFLTKLLVDGQIVGEKDLYIPTQGWQSIVRESETEFAYLKPAQLRHDSTLTVTPDVLTQLNQQPKSLLYLANLTDDPRIDGRNFSLETEFRMAQPTDRSVCQQVRLTVTGSHEVLGFHFTVPGCVGDLLFMLNQEMVSGRDHDLSAFGLDFSKWTRCRIAVQNNQLRVWLNGEEVFTHLLASNIGRVGGVQWTFEGAGEIRQLVMEDEEGKVDLMTEYIEFKDRSLK